MRSPRLSACLLLNLLFVAHSALADRVELSNRDVFSGRLIGIKNGQVLWAAEFDAGTLSLPVQSVRVIETGSNFVVNTTDGDLLRGHVRVDSGKLFFTSPLLGEVPLAWDKISGVEIASDPAPVKSPGFPATAAMLSDAGAGSIHGRGTDAPVIGTEQKSNAEPEAIQYAMRRSGYLLSKGESDLTTGFSYARSKSNLPFPGIPESRNLNLALDWRRGFSDRIEASVSLPVGWSSVRYSNGQNDVRDSATGLSDLGAGVRVMLSPEKLHWPEVVAFVQQSFPTGDDADANNHYKPILGTGHFSTMAGISFLKASDPLVLVGRISYNHNWNDWRKADYDLGNAYGVTLGLVFSVNHEAALGTEVNWRYQEGSRLRGSPARSESSEGAMTRFWLTYRVNKTYLIEPYVRFGLTNSESDGFELGGNLIRRF